MQCKRIKIILFVWTFQIQYICWMWWMEFISEWQRKPNERRGWEKCKTTFMTKFLININFICIQIAHINVWHYTFKLFEWSCNTWQLTEVAENGLLVVRFFFRSSMWDWVNMFCIHFMIIFIRRCSLSVRWHRVGHSYVERTNRKKTVVHTSNRVGTLIK